MTILDVTLDAPLLDAAQEVELARRIEAGLYADQLLSTSTHRTPTELEAVRTSGREAWQQLWASNLKLVMQCAVTYARRHLLPIDDLFQDGCLALAQAMQRYDHQLGTRFSTLAHDYVWRQVAASAAGRCGELEGPPHRQRVRLHLLRLSREHEDRISLRELAALAGVSREMAVQSQAVKVPIDLLPSVLANEVDVYERIEGYGTDFLNLLPQQQARFLRLRFGLDGPAKTLQEVADILQVSATTAGRMEDEALASARRLLTQDQCVLPQMSRAS